MFRPFPFMAPEGDSPAGGGAAAPAAGAAAPAAAPAGDPGSLIAEAGAAPAKPAEAAAGAPGSPAAPTKAELTAYLTGKGVKAEDLAKLDDAALKTKHDELKAVDAKADAISKIEVKVPDGAVIDEKQMSAFKEIIADAKLSPSERAQKLADMHGEALKNAIEAPVRLWMDTQKQWQDQVKADPELGGPKLAEVTASIAKVLDTLLPDAVENKAARDAFVLTGAGNHPALVRLLARAGKALGEGKIVGGNPPGSKTDTNVLAALYPSASDSKAAAAS